MPDIIWMASNGEEINGSDRVNITYQVSYENGVFKTSSSLKIFYPSNLDAGEYYCQTDNGISIAMNKSIVLLVLGLVNVVNFNGYQVEPGAVINSFPADSDGSGSGDGAVLSLDCTTRNNESARWEVINSTSSANIIIIDNITNSLSNLMVQIIEGEVTVRCRLLEYDVESVDVTITTENPYVRLVSNSTISATLGTRQELEFVIAIDSDGSKIGQSAISDSLVFSFTNSSQITVDLPEPMELDIFQHFVYMLPPVDTTLEGMYSVILGNVTVANAIVTLNDEVPTLKIYSSSNTTLEGQPLTLNCSTSQTGVVIKWLFNGTEISLDDERYMFAPAGLNTMITIINPNVSESGDYSCVIDVNSDTDIGDDTVITIFPACEADFALGILWDAIKRGGTATYRCSRLHPHFRDGVQIRRSCLENGRWGLVNAVDCTMFTNAQTIIIVSLILQPNFVEPNDQEYGIKIARNLTLYIMESNENTRNPRSEVRSLRSQDTTAIHISFEVQLSENVVSGTEGLVHSFLPNATYSLEVQGFQPSNSCSCNSSDGESSIKVVCVGAGTPPCVCGEERCDCNNPTFAGNGVFCGKNSDGDNFPDAQLPCDDQTCQKDECPELLSNSNNGRYGCPEAVPNGCNETRDSVWQILWPETAAGSVAKQKCPGGIESLGFATRFCDENLNWNDSTIDVSQCQSVEVVNIIKEVEALDNNASFTELVDITSRLSDILNSSTTPILPMDLQNSNDILNSILSVAIDSNNDDKQLRNISTDIVGVVDVILDERNDASFRVAEKNESSMVLSTTERVASTLASAHGNLSSGPLSIEGNNLFIEVQTPSDKDIVFPNKDDDNVASLFEGIEVIIPRNALLQQGEAATVVNFIATTLGPLLQRSQNSTMKAIRSSVVSSQISSSLPKDEAVFLTFKIDKQNISNPDAGCYFWNFTESEWSNAGITVNGTNDTYIQCVSSHLTSFAVLVASGEGNTVDDTALSVVSYIGCSISIVCLLLTLAAIFLYRKHVFNQVQHYIHFNLSLSLLLGLLVFVSGIETAVDSDRGCLVVALLLHYLFLAAFSWMLCEGFLLFLLLYLVFYKGFFKEWKFFTCLGWGLPIPVVVISVAVSHEHYGTSRACWISDTNGANWAFIAPIILIIMVNVFFIGMTLRRILLTKRNNLSAEQTSKLNVASAIVKAACVLLPLLGTTWIFGIFAVNEETVVFAWLFTVFNSLQGMFIFLFYVLRNEKFRERIMVKRADISKLFTSTGGDTLRPWTLQKETMSSSTKGQPNAEISLEKYNKVIQNEYVVSSTNLAPEYYQEHRSCVPNPFNMANTVDEFSFDAHDTMKSHRHRLSTKGIIKPSDYLGRNRQAVVYTNKSVKEEETTTL
ncbi:uncharacterized protein [Dysidea avara]